MVVKLKTTHKYEAVYYVCYMIVASIATTPHLKLDGQYYCYLVLTETDLIKMWLPLQQNCPTFNGGNCPN